MATIEFNSSRAVKMKTELLNPDGKRGMKYLTNRLNK